MSVELISTDVGARATRTSVLRRLLKDPQAVIVSAVLFIIVLLGLLAPVLSGHGLNFASLNAVNAPMGTPGYPLGADQSGRDIWARLLASINTSVIAGLIGASVAVLIGVVFGLIGGYFGRRLASATEWVFNLIMTFPGLLLLIVLLPVTKGDYRATMLIFGVLLSPGIYRIVRNLVIGVKRELFVDAARVSGLPAIRILGRHVLFVIRGPVIIATAFMIGAAIGVQAGLAFLGVGSKEVPSFGSMIGEGFLNLYVQPSQVLWPSLFLGLITAGLVLLGNSLRDVLEGIPPRPIPVKRVGTRATAARVPEARDEHSLLSITDLAIAYPDPQGEPRNVVHGVTLQVEAGEVVGIVGESGSGKTQTAFAALGVLPREAAIMSGSIRFEGRELVGIAESQFRSLRGRSIAYIPQEPMSNLDASYTVGAQLLEGMRATQKISRAEARERILVLLKRVGIADPQRTFDSFPHQISGGMAQRVLIAGAVASRPKLLIADEPTTALDVTVQAEILDLLRDLREELGMAVLLVTHNFGVVADICDRVAVMQGGRIVESGPTPEIFAAPQHPYTQMLLKSILDEDTVRVDPAPRENRTSS